MLHALRRREEAEPAQIAIRRCGATVKTLPKA